MASASAPPKKKQRSCSGADPRGARAAEKAAKEPIAKEKNFWSDAKVDDRLGAGFAAEGWRVMGQYPGYAKI